MLGGSSVERARRRVVFPAPLGPKTTVILPPSNLPENSLGASYVLFPMR